MDNKITVNSGDTLIKIVKREYGLQNDTDIMNTVNLIKQKNNLKNVNIIKVGQKLELPEQLRLNNELFLEKMKQKVLSLNKRIITEQMTYLAIQQQRKTNTRIKVLLNPQLI